MSLKTFNTLANTSYETVMQLIYSPLKFKDELQVRNTITQNPYDLSTIIILDEIQDEKYEVEINAKIYEDVKEKIIKESMQ